MGSKSKLNIGSPEVAANNRGRSDQAHEALTELVNYAISCKQRGSVGVRITFQPGYLANVRKIVELDTNGPT